MTVSTTEYLVQHVGDGSSTTFNVPYSFAADADLVVETLDTSDDDADPVTQTLNSDYTVSGAGNASGGSITFTTAPDSDTRVTIYRDTEATQGTDYTAYDTFPEESHENALDKLTRIVQEVRGRLGRTIKFPESEDRSGSTKTSDVPRPEEGKALVWDSDGNLGNGTVSSASSNTDLDALLITGDKGKRVQVNDSNDGYVVVGDAFAVSGTDTLTASVGLDGYNTNQTFTLKAAATNTGAVTLNLDSLGAKDVTLSDGTALPAGSLEAGKVYSLWYDGTKFIVINPSTPILTPVSGYSRVGGGRYFKDNGYDISTGEGLFLTSGGNDPGAGVSVTVGPTGSGADIIWDHLDNLPSSTSLLIVILSLEVVQGTSGGYSAELFAAKQLSPDSGPVMEISELPDGTDGAWSTKSRAQVEIPVQSGNIFNVKYTTDNVDSANIFFYVNGYQVGDQ